MAFGVLSRLARVRVTLTYAVILTVASMTLSRLEPAVQNRVVQDASTNLHNLGHGHLETLVVSAFVVDAGPEYQWVPGLVFLLGIGELLWRSGRLLVTLTVCHVGATLMIAAWLVAAVAHGWLPIDVASETDVGMSYGAIGVLGALTPAISRAWRLPWVGWWLGVATAVVIIDRDFAYLGHLVAFLLGMVSATRFGRPRPWTRSKLVLLILGASFGYLVLTSDGSSMPVATIAGLAGAVLGTVVMLLCSLLPPRSSSHPPARVMSPPAAPLHE